MESDHNSPEEQDGFLNISSDPIPWTQETALIYTIIEDAVTSDDKRVRLYEEYAEIMGVHGILQERCDMTYRQIMDVLARLAEWGVVVPAGNKRNDVWRFQLVDHVPEFAFPQQDASQPYDALEVLPPQGREVVEKPVAEWQATMSDDIPLPPRSSKDSLIQHLLGYVSSILNKGGTT